MINDPLQRLLPNPLEPVTDRERRLATLRHDIPREGGEHFATTARRAASEAILGELARLFGHLQVGEVGLFRPVRVGRDGAARLVVEQEGRRYILDPLGDAVYRVEGERVETYQRGRILQQLHLARSRPTASASSGSPPKPIRMSTVNQSGQNQG